MPNYHEPLIPGETYHIFSRAVGFEKLFLSDENYRYFLHKFEHHIFPVADLFTYSLLPNHFHLLARIKPAEIISGYYEDIKQKPYLPLERDLSDFIMERFSNWLNGYTKAFNKMHRRKGALFMDYLRRNHAKNETIFCNFVFYIHKNAVHHGLTNNIGEWLWDGYNTLVKNLPSKLEREALFDFFGGKDGFIKFHQRPVLVKEMNIVDI